MKLLLVRHAHTDAVGRVLAGRAPGHLLNAAGRRASATLAEQLAAVPLSAVYSSPLERAQETAAAIAEPHRLEVRTAPALHELDYGEWTGASFDELREDPRWREWNESRDTARVPGGESMVEAQRRVIEGIEALRQMHDGDVVAAVSHADIIRAALGWWLGIPLGMLQRLAVEPARTSMIDLGGGSPRVLWVDAPVAAEWNDVARA